MIGDNAFDDFINEVLKDSAKLKHEYCFTADVEGSRYTSYQFDVTQKECSSWDEEGLLKFLEGEYVPHITRRLLGYLCRWGVIEEGTYVIEIEG